MQQQRLKIPALQPSLAQLNKEINIKIEIYSFVDGMVEEAKRIPYLYVK